MTDQRQQSVRNLVADAFEGSHACEDILFLKQGIYEFADAHGVLAVIALDADLAAYHLDREAVRQRPAEPAPNALAAAFKAYDVAMKLYLLQDEGLRKTKHAILLALDQAVKKVIEEPVHGSLRRTVNAILQLLITEYGTMTHAELSKLSKELKGMRWDGSINLITFMTDNQNKLAFLEQHQFAPPTGEQVMMLQQAVSHVPAFAQMANNAFYQDWPLLADQTMVRLMATYRRVYRTQFVNTTASQHHATANQAVKEDTDESGIMASVRASLKDQALTNAQAAQIEAALVKAIKTALQPASAGTPRNHGGKSKKQPYAPAEKLAAGTCPMHPHAQKPHTWDQCSRNPDKK